MPTVAGSGSPLTASQVSSLRLQVFMTDPGDDSTNRSWKMGSALPSSHSVPRQLPTPSLRASGEAQRYGHTRSVSGENAPCCQHRQARDPRLPCFVRSTSLCIPVQSLWRPASAPCDDESDYCLRARSPAYPLRLKTQKAGQATVMGVSH